MAYKVGQRVMVYPHYDSDICHLGTVVDVPSGGWDECGGVYRVRFDSGSFFWCSEESMFPYKEEVNAEKEG